jgi:hypothetical protein
MLMGCFSGFVQGAEMCDLTVKSINEICVNEGLTKIFATPDQILITPDAIFVYTPNKYKLLKAEFIGIDDDRVFVAVHENELVPKRGPCGLHREWHMRPMGCGGCGVLLCPMNCTCFD